MKYKLLLISALSLIISNSIHAEYLIKIPLDPKNVSFEDADVTGSIKLAPTEINRGESSNIIWNYTHADKIEIEGVGDYNSLTGMHSVSPLESTTYNVLVTNGSKYKNETLYLNVIQPNQNITFNADAYKIGVGTSTNLNWNVSNAQTVSIDNGIGIKPLSGNYVISPMTDTTYTLTAKGFTGVSDKLETVSIIVVPDATINSFIVDNDKITVGDTATFSWDVKNAESLKLNDETVNKTAGSKPVIFTTAGEFPYQLITTSLSGKINYSSTKTVNVYNVPLIDTFTVNGKTVVDVSPSADLNFAWGTTYAPTLTLNNNSVSGTSSKLTANTNTGSTIYTLSAANEANRSVSKTVTVNVIGDAVLGALTAPSPVFANAPFTLGWTATGASKYTVNGNNANSGLSTSEEDVGMATLKNITPTVEGTYTYTVSAYNKADAKKTQSKTVVVEGNPTFDSFLVNGSTSISVSTGTALNYTSSGISSGAAYQGRTSSNDGNVTNPTVAPSASGTYTYYMAAAKTLNGVNRYSPLKSVTVKVVNVPILGPFTANPTIIDAGQSSTLSFSTAYSSNTTINGISMGANSTYVVTPTETTTYTLIARNEADQSVTKSVTVTVQNWTATTPVYGAWTNVAGKVQYNCGAWSPDPSTVTTNTTFNQTSSCLTDQTRTRQDRLISSSTGTIKNNGAVVTEKQTITQTATRSYGVTLSGWSGSTVSSCASWSPDTSTVNSGTQFTQTGANCSLPQTRTRTENYIDHVTGSNVVVSVVNQNQTLTVGGSGYTGGTRTATGTKATGPDCRYVKNQYYVLDYSSMGSDIIGSWGTYAGELYTMNYDDPSYSYTRGAAMPASEGIYMFQICRTPK